MILKGKSCNCWKGPVSYYERLKRKVKPNKVRIQNYKNTADKFQHFQRRKQIVIFVLFIYDTNKLGIHVVISRVILTDWRYKNIYNRLVAAGQKLSLKKYFINTKIEEKEKMEKTTKLT